MDTVEDLLKKQEGFEKTLAAQEEKFTLLERETLVERIERERVEKEKEEERKMAEERVRKEIEKKRLQEEVCVHTVLSQQLVIVVLCCILGKAEASVRTG